MHCINETMEEFTCKSWANCKTCENNNTYCLSCFPNHYGPNCKEVSIEINETNATDNPILSGIKEDTTCQDPGIPEGGNRLSVDGVEDPYPYSFLEGESAYFSCNEEDSILRGPSSIVCTAGGMWSDSLPWCDKPGKERPSERTCLYPGVDANGAIEDLEGRQTFPSGTRLKFMCRAGYRLEGQRALFCLCSGEWTSEPPICVPESNVFGNHPAVHCSGRGPISNGQVVEFRNLDRQLPSYEDNGYLYPVGSRLHYDCHDGYILKGARVAVCESSGLWSAGEPICIEDADPEKGTLPKEDNLERNALSNWKTTISKLGKQNGGKSNSLEFKFYFL